MYLELTVLNGKEAEKAVEDIRQIVAKNGLRRATASPARPAQSGRRRPVPR